MGPLPALVCTQGSAAGPVIWMWDWDHLRSLSLATPVSRDLPGAAPHAREAQSTRTCSQEGQEELCHGPCGTSKHGSCSGKGRVLIHRITQCLGPRAWSRARASTFIRQPFPSRTGVWTKTYNQWHKVLLMHPIHVGCCDGRHSKRCKRPIMMELSRPKGPFSCRQELPSHLHLPEQGSRWLSINHRVSAELSAFCVALRLPLPFHFSDFSFSTQHSNFLQSPDFIKQHQQFPPQSHLSPCAGRSIFLNSFFSWDMCKSTCLPDNQLDRH